MTSNQRKNGPAAQDGAALVSALVFVLLAVLLTGASTAVIMSGVTGTNLARAGETSRAMAEAGIQATIFKIEAATNPATGDPINIETYLANTLGNAAAGAARAGKKEFTGTLDGGSYKVTLTDPSAGDSVLTLTSVGTDAITHRTKTIVSVAQAPPATEALMYAMFGNRINFHNHNKVAYGVSLNTSMFSNGSISIDTAIMINGQAQAVNTISPDGAQWGLPATSLTPPGQQGDPNPDKSVPTAQIVQVVPGPDIKPFPTFDFAAAQTAATAAGRAMLPAKFLLLLSQARACAVKMANDAVARVPGYAGAPGECSVANVYLNTGLTQAQVPVEIVHYKTKTTGTTCPSSCPAPRVIRIPNVLNPDNKITLGSTDGVSNPPDSTHLYEIRLTATPNSNALLFIKGTLNLSEPTDTLVQIQGGLVVNGGVNINAPSEFLTWQNRTSPWFVPLGQTLYSPIAANAAQWAVGQPYDIVYSHWPAIAANGGIKLGNSGAGTGGPVHVEGVTYSVAESHFHKSNAYESSYIVGTEIADTIHNCQWFSLAYDPQAGGGLGFQAKASGRARLTVVRNEDR